MGNAAALRYLEKEHLWIVSHKWQRVSTVKETFSARERQFWKLYTARLTWPLHQWHWWNGQVKRVLLTAKEYPIPLTILVVHSVQLSPFLVQCIYPAVDSNLIFGPQYFRLFAVFKLVYDITKFGLFFHQLTFKFLSGNGKFVEIIGSFEF